MIAAGLARIAGYTESILRFSLWFGVVLAAFLLLYVVVKCVRHRVRSGDASGGDLWNLNQLRRMHAGGELEDAEFELLRTRAIVEACDQQQWTLQDLREMHARGELSDSELGMARARLIAAVNPPESPPEGPGGPESA